MLYRVDALQHRTVLQMQVSALSEEQRTAEESTPRHHHYPTATAGCEVDYTLYRFCLEQRRVSLNAIIGQHILSAKRVNVDARSVIKPPGHNLPVREPAIVSHYSIAERQGKGQHT